MSVTGFIVDGQIQKYDYDSLDNLPDIPENSVTFWVTYNVTTETEITNAFSDNKNVMMKFGNDVFLVTRKLGIGPSGSAWLFTSVGQTNIRTTWVSGSYWNTFSTTAIGGEISYDLKQALLQLASKVAYIDEDGQTYYNNLYNALYPHELMSISATFNQGSNIIYDIDPLTVLNQYLTVVANYSDGTTETISSSDYTLSGNLLEGVSTITVYYGGFTDTFNVNVTHMAGYYTIVNNLTGCTTNNSATAIQENTSYTATITASAGYTLSGATAIITMGGNILTGVFSNGTISIPNVTGDLVITVVASAVTLSSISAVYTQSGTVYDTDTLDSLKADLVVTAHYSDSSTQTVPAADYTLSGDLTHEQTIVDLLDGATWTDGIAFDDNGNQLERPTLACSDYLPVTPGTLYTYSKPVSGGTDAYGMGLYLYDSNKGWISRETSAGTQSGTEYVKTYTPASNVAYVRLMAYVTAKSGAEFTYDATPSSWTSTITVAYGGKTTTFNVTVTHRELMFVGASYGAGTSGGTVTFNQDGSVRLASTGQTNWGLCFSPYGSASAFKTWGDLKGHTVRLAYKITWAGKNSSTRLTAAGYLCSDLSRYDATRLRYSNFFDTNGEADASMLENKEGYIDLLIPSEASGWEAGTSAVSDSNYFSFRTYLVTSAAGADVTLDFKFYDMGVLS